MNRDIAEPWKNSGGPARILVHVGRQQGATATQFRQKTSANLVLPERRTACSRPTKTTKTKQNIKFWAYLSMSASCSSVHFCARPSLKEVPWSSSFASRRMSHPQDRNVSIFGFVMCSNRSRNPGSEEMFTPIEPARAITNSGISAENGVADDTRRQRHNDSRQTRLPKEGKSRGDRRAR